MTINARKRNKFLFKQGKHGFCGYKEAGNRYVRTVCKQAGKRTDAQTAEYPGIKDAGRKCFDIIRILDEQTVKDILYTAEKQEKNNDANQQRH